MNLGKAIKIIRIMRGLDQKEIAKSLDCSANYISLLENNKREPSLKLAIALAKTLNVSLSHIVETAETLD